MTRLRSKLILVCIGFHLFAFTIWTLPEVALFQRPLKQLVRPYLLWSGLWQSWILFAPEVPTSETTLIAEVAFADGTRAPFVFPRMRDLSGLESLTMERLRKWSQERLPSTLNPAALRDASRYVARRMVSDPSTAGKVPRGVRFAEQTTPIAPFNSTKLPGLEAVLNTPTNEIPLGVHLLTPDDLTAVFR